MDVLYTYRHSPGDYEIRYSLRSLAKYAPFVRKVWIYGDRPRFLTADTSVVEYVPHESNASQYGIKTPVKNFFWMLFLSSRIPDLTPEYLWFSDDFFLLKDYSAESARKVRYLQDLRWTSRIPAGLDAWKDQVWRTYDRLVGGGYGTYNFETHTPTYLKRDWVASAYETFRGSLSEVSTEGLTAATAILNHARRHENIPVYDIARERSRAGYWGAPPRSYGHVLRDTVGKTFLNFDDPALSEPLRKFLDARFPERSRFECAEAARQDAAA